MSKTTSSVAAWVIGISIVFLFVSCISSTMNDGSDCIKHMDQYGACVVADQP